MHLDFFAKDTLTGTLAEFDIVFDSDQYTRDYLKDAVILSLFCWDRVPEDEVKDGINYGWWASYFRDPVGSTIWKFQRSKILPELFPQIKQSVTSALQWLLDENIVAGIRVDVRANSSNINAVEVSINIVKQDNSTVIYNFADLWTTALKG